MKINHRRHRIQLIELTHRFDIKERCSGKSQVWNADGTPCDFLGIMLHELGAIRAGYSAPGFLPAGIISTQAEPYEDSYEMIGRLLAIPPSTPVSRIYNEIDRKDSTNASIRAVIEAVFAANPLPAA